jgi:rubrerythrin
MKHSRIVSVVGGCLLLTAMIWMGGCGKEGPVNAPAETLKNLQTAFNGESNAQAKYTAYAKQADKEGYGEVASLFRAAALSEGIHAANHAKVIRSMGAEPKAEIKLPEIKTTSENLASAIKGETYELTTMYPDFIKQAKADDSDATVQTFTWALEAEKMHAKYFQAALDDLNNWKGDKKTFIVCEQCGYTVDELDLKKCPICNEPEKYLKKVS